MRETVNERVGGVIRGILRDHLEVLVVLLAESGMDSEEQRERVELLVSTLESARLENSLEERGRAVASQLTYEPSGYGKPAPVLRLNGELLGRVDAQEIFGVLSRPVASLLGLSPVVVGLVFREQDARQLKMLAVGSAQGLEVQAVRLTAIRSWVTGRVESFLKHVRAVIELLAVRSPGEVGAVDSLVSQLMVSAEQWPEWFDVEDLPWMRELVAWAHAALEGAEEVPPAALLVEICWEGTALSVQSFLRHAARVLRGYSGAVDRKSLLHILAHAAGTGGGAFSADMAQWPGFAELEQAWSELWLREQLLAGGRNADQQVPVLSVFDAPGQALQLSAPETLPWDLPLLCWTPREYEALRDLLVGMTSSLRGQEGVVQHSRADFVCSVHAQDRGLVLTDGRFRIQVQPARLHGGGANRDLLQAEKELAAHQRAFRACYAEISAQFQGLEPATKQRVLNVLFSAYAGYLPQARAVWQRRFSGVKTLEPAEALRRLVLEFSSILRLPILLDPFETPEENELLAMPAFSLVVALSEASSARNVAEGYDAAMLRIPMAALKNLLGNVPIRLRVVSVPADAAQDCTWLCDHALGLRGLNAQPLEQLLRAIQNDMLYLEVLP